MKMLAFSLITLILSAEVFAQVGPRYNPPGRSRSTVVVDRHHRTTVHRPGPRVVGPRYNPPAPSGPVIIHDPYTGTYSRPVIVGPRIVHRPYSTRYVRTVRRPSPIWHSGFGYSCNDYGELTLNRRPIHRFVYSSDCHLALSDIQLYGDFCDGADMIDQSGYLEAVFSSNWECRDALPYYY